ncbi:MAG: shikimate kinase [Acidimicrobiia bacterium]
MADVVRHVVLIGEMGAGKTTIGQMLASEMGRPFQDSDRAIEAENQTSGAAIAAERGVADLHAIELQTCRAMLDAPVSSVLAVAASVIDTRAGRRLLSRHVVVVVRADDGVLKDRVAAGSHRRPTGATERYELERRRSPLYGSIADFQVDNSSGSPRDIARVLAAAIEARESG